MNHSFRVGDLVWAKLKGSPPWPSEIFEPPLKRSLINKNKLYVYFFGCHEYGWVHPNDIQHHHESLVERYSHMVRPPANFVRAIEAIVDADRYRGYEADEEEADSIGVNLDDDDDSRSVPDENSCRTVGGREHLATVRDVRVVVNRLSPNIISRYCKRKNEENEKNSIGSPKKPKIIVKINLESLRAGGNYVPKSIFPSPNLTNNSHAVQNGQSNLTSTVSPSSKKLDKLKKKVLKKKAKKSASKADCIKNPFLRLSKSFFKKSSGGAKTHSNGPSTSREDFFPKVNEKNKSEGNKKDPKFFEKFGNCLRGNDSCTSPIEIPKIPSRSDCAKHPSGNHHVKHFHHKHHKQSHHKHLSDSHHWKYSSLFNVKHHSLSHKPFSFSHDKPFTFSRDKPFSFSQVKHSSSLNVERLSVSHVERSENQEHASSSKLPSIVEDEISSSHVEQFEHLPNTLPVKVPPMVEDKVSPVASSLLENNEPNSSPESRESVIQKESDPEPAFQEEDWLSRNETEDGLEIPETPPDSYPSSSSHIVTNVRPIGSPSQLLEYMTVSDAPEDPTVDFDKDVPKLKDIRATPKKIGFIGLGRMGQRIVRNLINSRHKVTIWNDVDKVCQPFVEAKIAQTPGEVMKTCDIVFSCLVNVEASKYVFYRENGILDALRKCDSADRVRKGYVELTLLDSKTAFTYSQALKHLHCRFLEAPLYGSKADADDGNLSIIAAGDRSLFDECSSCFEAISNVSKLVGPSVGNASKYSILKNAISASVYAVVGEILALTEKMGLDKKMFMDLLDSERLLNFDENFTFYSCKDIAKMDEKGNLSVNTPMHFMHSCLKESIDFGRELNCPMIVHAAANEIYKKGRKRFANHDVAAIFQILREKVGKKV